jgi:hypothetical protein
MVVYVIYESNYEDSKVHGVWSSLEGAEKYVKAWMLRSPQYNLECNMDIIPEEVLP